jgi:hypothetical protein
MEGWIYVAAQGFKAEADLQAWVRRGLDFALSLPPK